MQAESNAAVLKTGNSASSPALQERGVRYDNVHFGCARVVLLGCLALVMTGCAAVGPNFEKPDVPAPEGWLETAEAGISTGASDHRDWWKNFNDPAESTESTCLPSLSRLLDNSASRYAKLSLVANQDAPRIRHCPE